MRNWGQRTTSVQPALPAGLLHEVEVIERDAYVQATRLQAKRYVAQVGLLAISSLAELESKLSAEVPTATQRLKALSEVAAGVILAQLMEGLS